MSGRTEASAAEPGPENGSRCPPATTRWKKGQSGNPKGRRKARTDIAEILNEALDEKTLVVKGVRKKKITNQKALLTALVNEAIRGNQKALREVEKLMLKFGLLDPPSDPNQLHGVFALTHQELKEWDTSPDSRLDILHRVQERDAMERIRVKQLNPNLRL